MNLDGFLAALGHALDHAAEAGARYEELEEQRKRVLAQEIVAQGDIPASKAEHIARAGERYGAFLEELAAARREAAKAKAKAEYLRVRWETWRSDQATQRMKERDHAQVS